MCVCVREMCVCVCVHEWRSEDNLRKSSLSLHRVFLKDGTQPPGRYLYTLSHLNSSGGKASKIGALQHVSGPSR